MSLIKYSCISDTFPGQFRSNMPPVLLLGRGLSNISLISSCLCVCVCAHVCRAPWRPDVGDGSLELVLQAAVSYWMWVPAREADPSQTQEASTT